MRDPRRTVSQKCRNKANSNNARSSSAPVGRPSAMFCGTCEFERCVADSRRRRRSHLSVSSRYGRLRKQLRMLIAYVDGRGQAGPADERSAAPPLRQARLLIELSWA